VVQPDGEDRTVELMGKPRATSDPVSIRLDKPALAIVAGAANRFSRERATVFDGFRRQIAQTLYGP
jgi:hypothetical protein